MSDDAYYIAKTWINADGEMIKPGERLPAVIDDPSFDMAAREAAGDIEKAAS